MDKQEDMSLWFLLGSVDVDVDTMRTTLLECKCSYLGYNINFGRSIPERWLPQVQRLALIYILMASKVSSIKILQ